MNKFKFLTLGLLCLSIFTFTSCDDDDEVTTGPTLDIVESAIATESLSSLVAAVTEANLVSTLQGTGPFTVFAPDNDAFQALLDSNPAWNGVADIDDALLDNVLKFHVLAGDVKAADLTDTYVLTLAVGPNNEQLSLQVDVTGGVRFNSTALPITTDVAATNGTVHIIDEVMLPKNIVGLAASNSNFSLLVQALSRADLGANYLDVLSGVGPFTVFAPTDEAFTNLLNTNPDWTTVGDIPSGTLAAVLNYHVVNGLNVQSDQLVDDSTVPTFGGANLTVDLSDGAKLETRTGQSVVISRTDIQGTNGVIHVIDEVMLP